MSTLLLTMAVQPDAAGPLALDSVARRRAQYLDAIRFWAAAAAGSGFGLAVVETTRYGAGRLLAEARVDRAVAFDHVPAEPDRARGKGAVEAAAVSAFVDSGRAGDFFVKCTGRLTAANGQRILQLMQRDRDALYVRMKYGVAWADTRMFAMPSATWQSWFGAAQDEVDDARREYLEVVVGRRALVALAHGVRVRRLPRRPDWRGTSGSTGSRYGGPRDRVVRTVARPAEALLHKLINRKSL